MKKQSKKNQISQFQKEEIKTQALIKGGPETSRGTTTTVQSGTG